MDLNLKAKQLRKKMFETAVRAGRGHLGGALSCMDILVSLYYGDIVTNDTKFILSKGHSGIALYTVLAERNIISNTELHTFCKNGSLLSEHPNNHIPGIITITGSLGNGLGIGAGIAFAKKLNNTPDNVFVLMGDGECNEGSVWEAVRFAAVHALTNLRVIVDCNGFQSTDAVDKNTTYRQLMKIWSAFGWMSYVVDGHNILHLIEAYKNASIVTPTVYIARTVKGKGISFMENNVTSHHGLPNKGDTISALEELSYGLA
jgi:transketolase